MAEQEMNQGNEKILPTIKYIPGETIFIPGQLILTGLSSDLDTLLQDPDFRTRINPTSRMIDFTNIINDKLPDPLLEYTNIKIMLCEISNFPGSNSKNQVWIAAQQIYSWAINRQRIIFAEPNFIGGDPGPGGGAGGINGCPGGTGGAGGINGSQTSMNNTGGNTIKSVYRNHWAFGPAYGLNSLIAANKSAGINLESLQNGQEFNNRNIDQDGSGSKILIFDTFNQKIGTIVGGGIKTTLQPNDLENVDINRTSWSDSNWDGIKFKMTVAEPVFNCEFISTLDDMSDHGGFVAGLINRVAPDTKLYLIKVLDKKTLGELYLLIEQLCSIPFNFLEEDIKNKSTFKNLVINLSLEALYSEQDLHDFNILDHLNKMRQEYNGSNSVLSMLLNEMIDSGFYMACLRLPLQILHKLNAVIIAAAGNDGDNKERPIRSDIPGRYPEVVSVMSSDSHGNLSHFSNLGNVKAPGGGLVEPQKSQPYCERKNLKVLCDVLGNVTPHALLGLVPDTIPSSSDSSNPSGLAFWWGTSFAAPLVSGLAALLMEKWGNTKSNVEIENKIKNNTNNGIIDVRKALNDNT